ncbi:hypothetical protein PG995_005800 [Apiospora arundinis]|uniref:Uncharacterized protein n=1 Tax=Apiospora arundinis TaxID=335852 RepID=A0ABR2IA07_9PEZI
MLVAIRKEAIEQIRRKGSPPVWQNDSTFAFIRRLAQDAPDKPQKHFERLSVGKYTNLSLLRNLLGFLTTDAKNRDLSDLDSSESE